MMRCTQLTRQLRCTQRLFSSKALPAITDHIHGQNFIAGTLSSSPDERRAQLQSRRRVHDDLPGFFVSASDAEVDAAVKAAEEAVPGQQIDMGTRKFVPIRCL